MQDNIFSGLLPDKPLYMIWFYHTGNNKLEIYTGTGWKFRINEKNYSVIFTGVIYKEKAYYVKLIDSDNRLALCDFLINKQDFMNLREQLVNFLNNKQTQQHLHNYVRQFNLKYKSKMHHLPKDTELDMLLLNSNVTSLSKLGNTYNSKIDKDSSSESDTVIRVDFRNKNKL